MAERTVLRESYLSKRAINGKFGKWNRHYFILDDSRSLAYYARNSGKLKGQIVITDDTAVTVGSRKFGEQCFWLKTPYVHVLLRCDNKKIRDEWVNSLSAAISEAKNQRGRRQLKQIRSRAHEMKYPRKVDIANSRHGTHSFKAGGSTFEVDIRYTLEKVIGQGAYGIVVAANDDVTKSQVAIKKIKGVFDNVVDAKRILREIKLLRFLRHKNISHVVDVMRPTPATEADEQGLAKGIVDNFHDVYLVLDKMDTDLHRVIYSEQQLSDMHVQFLMFQLLSAIVYLQSANVIHRDLKPSNVLVNSACEIRVCDFGLARGVENSPNDELTTYVVTRWYRAPELILASGTYSCAIDVWSIGCIFAELLTRKPLFAGEDFLHQLKLITSIIGTPTPDDFELMKDGSATRYLRDMEPCKKRPWNTVPGLENVSPEGLDLMDKLLTFSPEKRISAEEALKHPYLSVYHKQPIKKAKQTFDIEALESLSMNKSELRAAIMEEISYFRQECYGYRRRNDDADKAAVTSS